MTKEVDVKDLVTKRIVKIDKALDSMIVGSKEHVMAVGDLKKLADAWATIEDKRISEEDNVAKREEQKRLNDAEIEHKVFEDSMNVKRYEVEKEYKTNQNRITLGQVAAQSAISAVALGIQSTWMHRAFNQEYMISGGDSLLPPKSVSTELKAFKWFTGK